MDRVSCSAIAIHVLSSSLSSSPSSSLSSKILIHFFNWCLHFFVHPKVNAWPLSFSPNDELELFSFLLQAFYIPIQQNGSSTGIEKTLSLSVSFFYFMHRHTHIVFFVNAQVYQWASLYSLQCLTDPAHRGRVLLRKTRWKLVRSILQNNYICWMYKTTKD